MTFDSSVIHILTFLDVTALLALLITLAVIDIKHYLLPDIWNAALAFCFALLHVLTGWSLISPADALMGAAVGGGMLWLIRQAAIRYYHEDALGLGDVKLMTAAGLGLGFPNILLCLCIGSLIGLAHGFIIKIYTRMKTGQSIAYEKINVPAGLGLTAGIAIVMLIKFL